jgi:hypothetical protein
MPRFGAHDHELPSAKRGHHCRRAAAWECPVTHGMPEGREVGDCALEEGERRVRHNPRRVIDEGDEARLPLPAGIANFPPYIAAPI